MAKAGPPPPIDPLTVRSQVATDLGLTLADLGKGGAAAPTNAELARAMVFQIVIERSGYSTTEAGRLVGYRSKLAVAKILSKIDAGQYDTHAAVTTAGHTTAIQLKDQLEASAEVARKHQPVDLAPFR